MTSTRIAVTAGEPRAHVELAVGALAPRLISRDAARAHVAVAAAGMVLLGGDHVHIEIDVGPACTLEIEDVGGTVAYPGARSSWILDVRIGAGGDAVCGTACRSSSPTGPRSNVAARSPWEPARER